MNQVVTGMISFQQSDLEYFSFLHGLEVESLPRALEVQVHVGAVHLEEACGLGPVQ